ncbi:MAG: hypothetical protein OWS74_04595, partial [Firmicutes bacterium]|nr:hypothetical protein [Bacillota bacterium]
EALSRAFLLIGRPALPPPWAFAPWNDSVRGQSAAQELAQFLQVQRIPSGAIWIEDWMGSQENAKKFWMRPLSHHVHPQLYPDLPHFSSDLHQQGLHLLGYLCPEVNTDSALFKQAAADGMLVRRVDGTPATFTILGLEHAELDLTHPQAYAWLAAHLFEPAYRLGFDGWMADFGEYLPLESQLADGTSGWQTHNRYPLLWQKLHRQFWQEKRPQGDYTFFVRSAWMGSQAIAPIMWGGDSDTDWNEADGLPTVVPQALSASLSGFPFWATDIAGYMTLGLTPPVTKELFIRWLQVGALLPIMRTHHGMARPRNWNFRKDAETLAIYTLFARLHTAMFPLWYDLARKSVEEGALILRPLFVHYPEEVETHRLSDQFLIGSDLLVAPVVQPHAAVRRCYLPQGLWQDWWTGTVTRGGRWIEEPVSLRHIPLWIRHGAVLLLWEGRPLAGEDDFSQGMEGIVDRLSPADAQWSTQLVDFSQAMRYLSIYLTDSAHGVYSFKLPEGALATLTITPARLHPDDVDVINVPPSRYADHLPQGGGMGRAIWGIGGSVLTFYWHQRMIQWALPASAQNRWYIFRWLAPAHDLGQAGQ